MRAPVEAGGGGGLGACSPFGPREGGTRGALAGRQDPNPAEVLGRQELSAVLLRAGLRERVPRD